MWCEVSAVLLRFAGSHHGKPHARLLENAAEEPTSKALCPLIVAGDLLRGLQQQQSQQRLANVIVSGEFGEQ